MIFCIDNKSVDVYSNIKDLTNSLEWQDALSEDLVILDENGNVYRWDDSKKMNIRLSTIIQRKLLV